MCVLHRNTFWCSAVCRQNGEGVITTQTRGVIVLKALRTQGLVQSAVLKDFDNALNAPGSSVPEDARQVDEIVELLESVNQQHKLAVRSVLPQLLGKHLVILNHATQQQGNVGTNDAVLHVLASFLQCFHDGLFQVISLRGLIGLGTLPFLVVQGGLHLLLLIVQQLVSLLF